MCLDFFKAKWKTIQGDTLELFKQITGTAKYGSSRNCCSHILLTEDVFDIHSSGPITLLNTDYEILALIISNSLRPLLADLLHPS